MQAQFMTRTATEMGFTAASRIHITLPMEAADDLDPWNNFAG